MNFTTKTRYKNKKETDVSFLIFTLFIKNESACKTR